MLTVRIYYSKIKYPNISTIPILKKIEKLRRNIWLELNSYLTPLEQVNVLTSIIYGYYNLKGIEVGYQHPDEFLIHKVIETKRGNTIINGIVYLLLSELLDIPIKAINVPRQFVLAYIKPELAGEDSHKPAIDRIEFFIDPMSGQVFTQKDVANYFNRIAITPSDIHFKPSNH